MSDENDQNGAGDGEGERPDQSDGGQSDMNNVVEMRRAVEARKKEEAEKFGKDGGGGSGITSRFVIDCLRANELGDGLLYRELHRGKFCFNKAMDRWMQWNGHHWEIDILDQAKAAVENVVERYLEEAGALSQKIKELDHDSPALPFLKNDRKELFKRISQLRTMRRRNNCLTFAHTCADPLAVRGDEIDHRPWLLACKNCVVDLKTGKDRPGRPEDYLMKACPVEWKGIDAPRDAWVKALFEIMDNDELMVQFLQRLFGSAIVGAVYENIFPVLTGPGGRNGKTTIVEAISRCLGPLAGPIPSEMLLAAYRNNGSSGPTPDLMALRGLRVAWASETEDGAKVSPAKVKWLTGGDSITARGAHDKLPTTFEPSHSLFLLSNFKPHADAQDKAFWERMINIPFRLRFLKNREPKAENDRKADLHLKEKLRAEDSGILGWLVEGCLLWQKDGLALPPKVVEETESYQKDEDNISTFVDWCCLLNDEFSVGATDLYNAFEAWWKKHVGNFPPKQKKFGGEMRRRFKHDKVGGVYRYFGVGLNFEVVDLLLQRS